MRFGPETDWLGGNEKGSPAESEIVGRPNWVADSGGGSSEGMIPMRDVSRQPAATDRVALWGSRRSGNQQVELIRYMQSILGSHRK